MTIKIGLNCNHTYDFYDHKKDEHYFETYDVYVKKVTQKAVLLRIEDPFEGRKIDEFWMPLSFVKLKKEGKCWFLIIDYEKYCKWFNRTSGSKLMPCASLKNLFAESKYLKYTPLWDEENQNIENTQVETENEDVFKFLDVSLEEKSTKSSEPSWMKELEKLIERLTER